MKQFNKIDNFWEYTAEELYSKLNSSAFGITSDIALKHRNLSNHPRVRSRLAKDLRLFLSQLRSPLMLLLIGAVLLSLFIGESSDSYIILFILLSTSIISFLQERSAGRVVEKLQSLIQIRSKVIRDGNTTEISSSDIVCGDVIVFSAGDIVPADCLLIESNELHSNESELTGESFPVRKSAGPITSGAVLVDRTNCLWEGSSIVSGTAKALVVLTGSDTVFNTIIEGAEEIIETGFEKGIREFGFMLIRVTFMLSILILVISLFHHRHLMEAALFALALAVGMAPELLPAITTIAMSAGAKKLLVKRVIVKKLNAVQNLGEVNLLCTDKTGTITEGAIRVESITDASGKTNSFIRNLAIWNASLETGYANPMDLSIRKLNTGGEVLPEKISEIPYDFIRKRLSVAVCWNNKGLLITKGAFRQCLDCCDRIMIDEGSYTAMDEHREKLIQQFEFLGSKGYRVIAVCFKEIHVTSITKEDEINMVFGGFILLDDPVKTGVKEAIAQLNELGIGFKMLTGDNRIIAASIARQMGILEPVIMTGEEVANTSPEALSRKVERVHIFSEIEPHQKERIILALKQTFTVAYMGDGINDVPAINASDVGITVDNATDVAREAADFILLEKDLSVIAEGIRQGRKTFANTLKYIYINTGSTFGNMCSVTIASLFLPFLPMLPKQILLTNFLSDFPFLSIPSDNVDEEQLQKPGKWNMKTIRNYMVVFGIHSSLFDLFTFSILYIRFDVSDTVFQTGWFVESVLTELLILFVIRTRKSFTKSRPATLITFSGICCIALTLLLPYLPFADRLGLSPLPTALLLYMLSITALYMWTADVLKKWFFRWQHEL